MEELSTKLKSAKEYRDTSVYVTQINDTVVSLPPRRGFFRRFADLFSPKKDTVITVNARFDTVKRINPDTFNLYSEADDLAMEALSDYNKSLESIVKRINVVITANRRLAYRIYSILYELNGRMLGSVLESVSVTEREADSNYALSLAGGVLASQIENSFIPGQFENPANPTAHYKTTGPEIYEQTEGKVDIFVAGVGTGGTISGIGKYLKEKNPEVKVVAVEPASSPVLSTGKGGAHKIQGIGAGFVPETLDTKIYDEIITVENEDAFATGKEMAFQATVPCGIYVISAGIAAGIRL